ncbi:hypothetical protein [Acidocella sp.]|uniref:hypothetical protein n=1 Tax=Acidocella sp. TaxID=50710 RepID=UPI0017E13EE5|nr:hypothetical protein [Acidocella sp.]NNM56310.1 hypothetical protein [Acidocella sp.]
MTCLEQLLALRPVDEQPETLQGAIDGIKVLKEQFRHEEKRLSHFRQHTMLMSPIKEIQEADARLLELGRVPAQADELIAGLSAKLHESRKKIMVAELAAKRAVLARKKNDLLKRFHAFYRTIPEQFCAFMDEDEQLKAATGLYNFEVEQCGKEFFYTDNSYTKPPEIANLSPVNLDPAYEDITILVAPNLVERASSHIPLGYSAETKKRLAISRANQARADSWAKLAGQKVENSY